MPPIVTPGQLSRRGEFYHQLAQFVSAGASIHSALQHLERSPPARAYAEPLRRVQAELQHGLTLTEAFQRVPGWLPDFDLSLMGAGEQSGRLDSCLRVLANYYQDRARMARQMISDLIYPVVLLHIAVFLLPFANFFLTGDWLGYLRQTFGVLLPIYAVVFVLLMAGQSQRGEQWRSVMESVVSRVPVLGKARQSLALARLAAALEALLSAGVTIIEAWGLAARASGSPRLQRLVEEWHPHLSAGQTPAELVNASGYFPPLFCSQYATGEVSGSLEENLQRLHRYYQEDSSRKLHELRTWTPRLFYFAVVLLIAWRVISFWSGYFKQVQNVINF